MKKIVLNCPQCKKEIVYSSDNKNRPFCSDRCRLIDLGEWASEKHVIKGEEFIVAKDDENEI